LLLAVIQASVDPSIGRRPVVGHSPPIDDPGIDGWKAGSLSWSDEDGWTIPDTRATTFDRALARGRDRQRVARCARACRAQARAVTRGQPRRVLTRPAGVEGSTRGRWRAVVGVLPGGACVAQAGRASPLAREGAGSCQTAAWSAGRHATLNGSPAARRAASWSRRASGTPTPAISALGRGRADQHDPDPTPQVGSCTRGRAEMANPR
jgi:hypothetical protein